MPSPIGFLSTVLACVVLANCLTPAEWRRQSIYQVMTDRFARSDGSTTASCDLDEYCGGTWIGLINQLDYIQQMGFTAVRTYFFSSLNSLLSVLMYFSASRSGSVPSSRTRSNQAKMATPTMATGRKISIPSTPNSAPRKI